MEKTKDPILSVIKGNVFFQDLSETDLADLAKLFPRERTYSRNEILVMAGSRWENIYFIRQGIIRLYYTDMDGREHNKDFYRENHILWPVAPSARAGFVRFSIAPIEEACVYCHPFSSFQSWLVRHHLWERFVVFHAEFLLEDKYNREYEFLMNSATERYKHFCMKFPDLVDRIPDYHLASYLGMTNVSLSRIKNSADFNLC